MSYYRHGPYRPSGVSLGVPALTPMVKRILIVTVAVWLAQILLGALGLDLARGFGGKGYGLGLVPDGVIHGGVWQLVTYAFLHNPMNPVHILFNMLMLWMFGGELERFWGGRAFLRYYLVCAAGGGVSATLLGLAVGGNDALTVTIGASGALFGLFVAFGVVFARRTVLFMLFFPMQARTMALILVGLNFFYLLSQPGSGVSHVAHLGGAAAGYLFLKRAWRLGEFFREMRWKFRRRKFKVMSPRDPDEWLH
jgi:membrane associated rhomboid family serine protease